MPQQLVFTRHSLVNISLFQYPKMCRLKRNLYIFKSISQSQIFIIDNIRCIMISWLQIHFKLSKLYCHYYKQMPWHTTHFWKPQHWPIYKWLKKSLYHILNGLSLSFCRNWLEFFFKRYFMIWDSMFGYLEHTSLLV